MITGKCVKRSELDLAMAKELDAIGHRLMRGRWTLDDARYREVLRTQAKEMGRYVDDLVPAAPRAVLAEECETHPLYIATLGEPVHVHFPESGRIQDLQETGNRLLEEARTARRERDEAIVGESVWRRRALEFEATAKRMDPIYGEPDSVHYLVGIDWGIPRGERRSVRR